MGLQKQHDLPTQEGCLMSKWVPTEESFLLSYLVLLVNVGSKNYYLGVSSGDYALELGREGGERVVNRRDEGKGKVKKWRGRRSILVRKVTTKEPWLEKGEGFGPSRRPRGENTNERPNTGGKSRQMCVWCISLQMAIFLHHELFLGVLSTFALSLISNFVSLLLSHLSLPILSSCYILSPSPPFPHLISPPLLPPPVSARHTETLPPPSY